MQKTSRYEYYSHAARLAPTVLDELTPWRESDADIWLEMRRNGFRFVCEHSADGLAVRECESYENYKIYAFLYEREHQNTDPEVCEVYVMAGGPYSGYYVMAKLSSSITCYGLDVLGWLRRIRSVDQLTNMER